MKHSKTMNFIVTLLLLMAPILLFSQKIVKTSGSAQVKVERNMTLEEAQEKAKELAKINAIENAYGSYTEQQFDITIADGQTAYNTIGTTQVKGDWIETMEIRFKDDFRTEAGPYGKQQVRYVTCYIKGEARKTVPKANIEFEVLSSSDPSSRTLSFNDGQQLYLYFKSPVDGYLSVYLDTGDTVFRLLPYNDMDKEFQSGVIVKGDRDYIFFSPSQNAFTGDSVDQLVLRTNSTTIEYNYLIIVFAEDNFVKPMLNPSEEIKDRYILPKSLNPKKFQKWLAYNRAASTSFQDRKTTISIEPNNKYYKQ